MLSRLQSYARRIDWVMLGAVGALLVFGFSAIYSVELGGQDGTYTFLNKQFLALLIGLGLAGVAASLHVAQWRNLARFVYVVGIILLIAVLIFGTTIRGTTGWFTLLGFSFQPVEFMKIGVVLALARYMSSVKVRPLPLKDIVQSGVIAAIPVGLVLLQPDLGSASIIVGTWALFVLYKGVRWQYVLVAIGIGMLALFLAWQFVFAEYQKDRVRIFMNPSLDPLGSGYNITQARIAIGSGGLLGRGLGEGSQSQLRFLPESQTDFIFAVIAEELGFLGVSVLFLSFIVLFFRLYRLRSVKNDEYAQFLAMGILFVLFVQTYMNVGVNLGILPATGVALPFVSYGGSSLLVSLFLVGLGESIAIHSRSRTDLLARG
jgi:rod shape determining protein RodA